MQDHFKQCFSDTVTQPGGPSQEADVSAPAAMTEAGAAAGDLKQELDQEHASFLGDLWPEAADAQCSESAALFAGTQPAPLSVV